MNPTVPNTRMGEMLYGVEAGFAEGIECHRIV